MRLKSTIGRSIVLWIALLHIGASAVYAEDIGDRLYPIIEITDRQLEEFDLTDGSLEEWKTHLAASMINRLDLFDISDLYTGYNISDSLRVSYVDDGLHDPNDLDFQFWLGWNQSTNRLYVAVECFDNEHLNEYEGGLHHVDMWYEVYEGGEIDPIWAYDSVEFLVDGDHSGGEYGFHPDCCATQEEWQQVQNSQAQQYYVINQSPRDPLVKYAGVGLWVNRPPYADVGGMREFVSRRVDKWVGQQHRIVTEFYVTPFDSLAWDSPQASKVSPLFPNKVIGFSLAVADLDTPIGYNDGHGFHSLYTGSSATWRNADYFVDGLLVEAPAPATVVEGWSWGRIKAAFGFEDGE